MSFEGFQHWVFLDSALYLGKGVASGSGHALLCSSVRGAAKGSQGHSGALVVGLIRNGTELF